MITRGLQRLQRALGVGKERFFVGNDLAGNRYFTRSFFYSYYEKHLAVGTSSFCSRNDLTPACTLFARYTRVADFFVTFSLPYLPREPFSEARPRRFVNFKSNHDDPTLYRTHHLPPQWSSWLSFTRKHPPTIELSLSSYLGQELQADQLRLSQLQKNVKRLEQQDRARKQALLEKENTSRLADVALPDLRESVGPVDDDTELNRKREKMRESPLAAFTLQPQTNPDQTWQPQSWNPEQTPRK
ncbi:hypothetical protein VP01_2918g2 [Puccinia sorghi]|uniref:Uncharacterized protein n=1 Tax=Puccinia sorghi TaxID=27349 RepID=A0A0L6V1B0_9BASI|nr:hypothetical protein VP01_2918g2 [Puccinia sorghi]